MRKSGILMPLFSLPGGYGIGAMGGAAFGFVDFLKKAGQSVWQLLPQNPTGCGDSPYQPLSSFAGNPYFIDIDELIREGLLEKREADGFDFGDDSNYIDYGLLYQNRQKLLSLACARFLKSPPPHFTEFCGQNAVWLDDFAVFSALKRHYNGTPWREWESGVKYREPDAMSAVKAALSSEIQNEKVIQYLFFRQWASLKWYAHKNGVELMGDLPIYAAYDSADVWAQPEQFELDYRLEPVEVAGCPPDAFSEDGQLWGNPLYDWAHAEKDGFLFWKRRLGAAISMFDCVRLDHFRGFEAYYSIPNGSPTAENGRWRRGPGARLFNALKAELGELPVVAEDLGYLTKDVKKLLAHCGFAGMKVLQFAFDPNEPSDYLPYNYDKNCVVYTGTHDNDTLVGWQKTLDAQSAAFARKYIADDDLCYGLIRAALASVANTAIVPIQDYIRAGSEARINEPATAFGNWRWRIDGGCLNDWLASIIYDMSKIYGRVETVGKGTDRKKNIKP